MKKEKNVVSYVTAFSALKDAMVELNAHATNQVSKYSKSSWQGTSLPARHLAHALLDIIVHASAKAE